MADVPATWTLMESAKTCVERITSAGGFYTDIGHAVALELQQQDEIESSGIYCGIVLAEESPAQDPAVSRTHSLVTFSIVPMVRYAQGAAQLTLHHAIADIKRCMRDARADFPPGLQFPRFSGVRPIPPAEGMTWIGAEVRYVAHVPLN